MIKHCSDNEDGDLGVDYSGYKNIYDILKEAETYSDDEYKVVVKWSKIESGEKRSYQRCFWRTIHVANIWKWFGCTLWDAF